MITEGQIVSSSKSKDFLDMLGDAIGKMQGKGYEVDVQYKPVAYVGSEEGVIYTALVLSKKKEETKNEG